MPQLVPSQQQRTAAGSSDRKRACAPARVQRLQQTAGNRVVARLLQGRPSDGAAALAAVAQLPVANRAVSGLLQRQPKTVRKGPTDAEYLDEALDDYTELNSRVTLTHLEHWTHFRDGLLRDLHAELDNEHTAFIEAQEAGRPPARAAVERFRDRLADYENLWYFEVHAGEEAWKEVRKQYDAETQRLSAEGDFASMAASKYLGDKFRETERLVSRLHYKIGGSTQSFVISEDLAALTYMMIRGQHLEVGWKRAQQMQKAVDRDLAEYEAEEAESLVNVDSDESLAKQAWQVFGWDSVGDFAGDVALTLVTFGFSKWFRAGARAAKARRRAARLKELRALITAKRAQRAQKKISRAKAALHLFRVGTRSALEEQWKWLKKDWVSVGRKAYTDALATKAQGKDPVTISGTVAQRTSKEALNASVMKYFGKDDKYERRMLRAAWATHFKGKDDLANRLYATYFMLNVRRRLLVNVIFNATVEGGDLQMPSAATLHDIASSTVGECVQDVVVAVPVFGLPGVKDGVETLRKWLVREAQALVRG